MEGLPRAVVTAVMEAQAVAQEVFLALDEMAGMVLLVEAEAEAEQDWIVMTGEMAAMEGRMAAAAVVEALLVMEAMAMAARVEAAGMAFILGLSLPVQQKAAAAEGKAKQPPPSLLPYMRAMAEKERIQLAKTSLLQDWVILALEDNLTTLPLYMVGPVEEEAAAMAEAGEMELTE